MSCACLHTKDARVRRGFYSFYIYDANDFLSHENILKLSVNTLGTWSFVSERGVYHESLPGLWTAR